jgi:Spy/CpxP family protein refolding chaperone
MKSIHFRVVVAALAIMLGTAIANSQTADSAPPMHHNHEFGMGHMMGFPAKYLDLSDAQRAQMKAIMEKEHPTMKPLMQQLRQTHEQLKQYEQGTYDEAKVRALATQESQTMVELAVQKTRIHNELYQMLTPEQQTKLKEFEANREARMQKHMQMHEAAPAPPQE